MHPPGISRRGCDSSRSVSFILTIPLGDIGATPEATVPAPQKALGPANEIPAQARRCTRPARSARKYQRRNGAVIAGQCRAGSGTRPPGHTDRFPAIRTSGGRPIGGVGAAPRLPHPRDRCQPGGRSLTSCLVMPSRKPSRLTAVTTPIGIPPPAAEHVSLLEEHVGDLAARGVDDEPPESARYHRRCMDVSVAAHRYLSGGTGVVVGDRRGSASPPGSTWTRHCTWS